MDKELEIHTFVFNKDANGGEQLILTTKLYTNGDGEIDRENHLYFNQKLTLNSYGNAATIMLYGASLNPENLRRLANEIDSLMSRNK